MIIVEGPDGSGKTTLIEKLQHELKLPLHGRFCNSDGTVTDNEKSPRSILFDLAMEDIGSLSTQPPCIYDRHPMISEYVYGPIIRGELPEGFETNEARRALFTLANHTLLIICRPPLRALVSSVTAEKQMLGVLDNILPIRAGYDLIRTFWPVPVMTYNREELDSLDVVLSRAAKFVNARTK